MKKARGTTQLLSHWLKTFVGAMPRTKFFPQWLWATTAVCCALLFFVLGMFIAWASVITIPSIDNFENRKLAESTKIYDRTGNIVFYDVHGSVRRTTVPLEQVSPFIQKATIALEDAQFYQHHGVRFSSLARALWADITQGGYSQGGSTITQQVVKNTLLTQDKTLLRKVKEIVLAMRLDRMYPKNKILETYLNEVGYGGTVYGVQEASQYFFGVDAKDVNLAEASYLAALPQAPTHLSPYGNHRNELDSRAKLALDRMLENGLITQQQLTAASKEKVVFRNEAEAGIKAPHFVFYIRDYLEQKYGSDAVENGGLRVITTLDYDLQQKAESVVHRYALSNEKNFNASNAGLVAVEPKTGQILAMVGSRDYFDPAIDGKVNITLAQRQPGSSFKPFVYATALQKGYTPETIVFDLKTQFSTTCQPQDVLNDAPPCYSPDNYDGTFKGPMTFRDALATSENIPAIKVLYLAGIKDSIKTAKSLGISTLGDAGHYGLTLVLGGGEVTLLEMTSAYSVFANEGIRAPATGILRVEDKNGNILESYQDQSTQVLEPQIARQINDILSDNVARTPEFGADSPLFFSGHTVADKTGTTNDFRDTWIIGYTPGIAAGSWAGNNDNSPMVKKIAAFIVAPMWHEFMVYALAKYPGGDFTPPSPDTSPETLPPVLNGNWNSDPSQGVHDILYWVKKSDPRAGPPTNASSDSQFYYWEYPVQQWAQTNGSLIGGGVVPPINDLGDGGNSTTVTSLSITSPAVGTFIAWQQIVSLSVAYPSTIDIQSVTYYINGTEVGTASSPPFTLTARPMGHGPTIIRAVAHTPGGNIEATEAVSVQ